MKNKSIVLKLFIITTVFFSAFILIFMVMQISFFKTYYVNTKLLKLKDNLQDFTSKYESGNWSDDSTKQKVNEFANGNNSQIAVLNKEGEAKYSPAYGITIEASDKQKYRISLNNIAYLQKFQQLKLAEGAYIEAEGFVDNRTKQVVSLHSIKSGDTKWENVSIAFTNTVKAAEIKIFTAENVKNKGAKTYKSNVLTAPLAVSTVTVTQSNAPSEVPSTVMKLDMAEKDIRGKIIELNIPAQIGQMADYNKSVLWESIEYWRDLVKANKISTGQNNIVTFHYLDSLGRDNIALVEPLIKNGKDTEFVFVISSLQPVGEAVDAMKTYYIYAFAAAFILLGVMALVFSRIVARPLIKMNGIATKMAELDFSEECEVRSGDELGSLAVNLNRLSSNLGTSLTELKDANKKLKIDIEKERSLEVMRREFVSSVSHEFKTPLGIIKGFAEGLKDNIAENKRSHYIDVILDEIEKMDELVLDLLDLARLESRAYELKTETFCIVELIDSVQNRLQNQIDEKNITIRTEYEHENVGAQGDRRRIDQVITNIFTNAIRHTPESGHIFTEVKELEGKVVVSIENSGGNISEEDMPKIWDRFYRAEKSRDRKRGGTGLGLCIVKNILEMHKSSYGVINTDKGVKFYFTLEK